MTDNTPAIPDAPVQPYLQHRNDAVQRVAAAAEAAMTKGERDQLIKVIRARTRVALKDVDARKTQILAEGESALARRFSEQDEAFADLMKDARVYIDDIAQKIDTRAAELGIPATFRPGPALYWLARGENADPRRRGELRKVLQAQAEATAQAAKLEVERWSSELQTVIIAGGLVGDARALLNELPNAETLMPPLALPELGR